MRPIHVIGIGLDGAEGLSPAVRHIVEGAALLVGSDRHLGYFPEHPAPQLVLGNLGEAIQTLREEVFGKSIAPRIPSLEKGHVAVLVSGDPLFYGLGRLLVAELPPEVLVFHPHVSSIQLAFSRIKLPWQDAHVVSAHGRSLDELTQALQQGSKKIAVLTDSNNTPGAIAQLLCSLNLPTTYQCWVCENLGGLEEQTHCFEPADLLHKDFAPLNVMVLVQTAEAAPLDLHKLPLLGIPDSSFLSFSDRPGLMTKREVRLQILGELALQNGQVVWDIGAGTGSVSVEIARLCPNSQVYAIEKTAAGISLIEKNCHRFQVKNMMAIAGAAPAAITSAIENNTLPPPNRIFIGGSGGHLPEILDLCATQLQPNGVVVLALATVEHCAIALTWAKQHVWDYRLLQVNLSRSAPIASLTRLSPLNPVTLVTLKRPG